MSVPVFEIRAVTAVDVPVVVELVQRVLGEFGLGFGEGCHTDTELWQLPLSYSAHRGAFWVVESDDGRLTGTCGVLEVEPGCFELRKMYLLPEMRGLGMGERLLQRAVEHVQSAGAHRLVLDTVDEMQGAIAFYEGHGFRRDDSQIRAPRCTRGYVREW